MNRIIESYVIYLREDIQIANHCKNIKNKLLSAITNKTDFSEELAAYFTRSNPNEPFKVLDTDPTQVVLLKKLLNAFEHAEKGFRAIETVDLHPDRYSAGLAKEAVKKSFEILDGISSAFQLLNHSSIDMQTFAGPFVQQLLPKMTLVSEALSQFTPEQPENSTGSALGAMINMLPTEKMAESKSLENVGQLLSGLPHYFEELQKLIATGDSGIATKSNTSKKEYQAAMAERTARISDNLKQLSESGGLVPYMGLGIKLLGYSSELVNTAAPLTKQAYLDAVAKLNEIKHDLLPQFIAEIETVEENMGLKAGVLTKPALKQMNQYYTQLTNTVEKIAKAAGVIDKVADNSSLKIGGFIAGDTQALSVGKELKTDPKLHVMMDDGFNAKRKELQVNRLHETRLQAADTSAIEAAERFFAKINSYGYVYQGLCKRSLANLYQNDKDELMAAYKQFQAHFAALHPDIDKLIVDALTQSTGSNIVSRMYSSDYKQLISSNHFTQVLNCKDSVLSNMKQSNAQTAFKAKLIEKTIANEESLTYARQNQITELHFSTEPFKELQYIAVKNQPIEFYHDKALAVAKQITELEQAQQGINAFFTKINEVQYRDSTQFSSLNDADKEYLCKQYISFQAQLIAIDHRDVNNKLVNSLKSGSTEQSLDLYALKLLHTKLNNAVKESITNLTHAKQNYVAQEQQARKALDDASPLQEKGLDLEKPTLFGQMDKNKLSQSLDGFIKGKFQTFLKNNLSESIWRELSSDGENIDLSKLPFFELRKDTEEVVMYKQLINSLYFLKLSLTELESLNDKRGLLDAYRSGTFLKTLFNNTRVGYVATVFKAILINIPFSANYLVLAARNPALKSILSEGLELLEPLKNHPLLGDYLKSTNEEQPAVQINLVEEWKKQVAIFNASRLNKPTPKPTEPVVTPVVAQENTNNNTPSYLQQIAEGLYKIPAALSNTKPSQQEMDANIKAFVDGLDGLSMNSDSAKRVLNTLSKVQMQVSEIGKAGRELSMSYLKEIKSEIGTPLMEAADNLEFHLGLKPGTYSNIVSERFDRFYENLIANIPLQKEQEGLDFILDVTSTKKRLQRELERLHDTEQEKTATIIDTKEILFGGDYAAFDQWYQPYLDLKSLAAKLEQVQFNQYLRFEDLKSSVEDIYNNIQPELADISPDTFDANYIAECTDEDMLIARINHMLTEQQLGDKPDCALAKIIDLYLVDGYENDENKETFLKLYQEIQPYLFKADDEIRTIFKYDLRFFVRNLQTTADFNAAVERMLRDRPKLQELIEVTEVSTERHSLFAIDLAAEQDQITQNLAALEKLFDLVKNADYKTEAHKAEFIKVYKELQPTLQQMDLQYDPEFLSRHLKSDLDFLQAVSKINKAGINLKELITATEKVIGESATNQDFKVNTALGELINLYVAGDFIKAENQQKFIEIYNILRPYLNKVDNKFNQTSFASQLATAEDFYAAARQILNARNKLPKVEMHVPNQSITIGGLEHAKDLKIKLAEERCNYFLDLLIKQEKEINPEKIRAYKEKVYDDYINTNIKSQLETKMGTQQAAQFLELVKPALQAIRDKILEKITIKDDMNSIIGVAIDAAFPEIEKNTEAAFKEKIFDDALKVSFEKQLGVYTNVFIMSIKHEIDLQKQGLKDLPIDADINNKINEQLIEFITDIVNNNADLLTALTQLDNAVKQLDQKIKTLSGNNNPCREEQICKLIALKERLEEISSIETNALNQLHEDSRNELVVIMDKYEPLVEMYDSLETLKKKKPEVSELQKLLANASRDPSERLNAVSKELDGYGLFGHGFAYRHQLAQTYINTTIKQQFDADLGDFSAKFLQRIKPEFKVNDIIKVYDGKNLKNILEDRIEDAKEDILLQHTDVKALYTQLNVSLQKINSIISMEETLESEINVCRKEKIVLLNSYKEHLLGIANGPEQDQVEFLQTQDSEVKTMLSTMSDYDAMITAHDALIKMENYIVRQDRTKPEEFNKDKLAEISHMKDMLLIDSKLKPAERVTNLQQRGNSKESADILLKNSDNFFEKIWNWFLSIFTGWQSKDEQKFGKFKERLHAIETPAADESSLINTARK